MKKSVLIFLFLAVALSGCFYDNYTELYPAASSVNNCDTASTVTYSKQVSSVMNGYCKGCHSETVPNGNTALDSYSGTMSAASSGKLIGAIRHQSGYTAMPPNAQLDECSIREVEIWIKNNYPQ